MTTPIAEVSAGEVLATLHEQGDRPRHLEPALPWVTFPGTVWQDGREKHPLSFAGFAVRTKQGRANLLVSVRTTTLATGDYSVTDGHEPAGGLFPVAVERKSREDMIATLSGRRKVFTAELARMNGLKLAAVVVECPEAGLFTAPLPVPTRMPPAALRKALRGLMVRFPAVTWHFCAGRRDAERRALCLLAGHLAGRVKV